jgi:hypothetical protein
MANSILFQIPSERSKRIREFRQEIISKGPGSLAEATKMERIFSRRERSSILEIFFLLEQLDQLGRAIEALTAVCQGGAR